MTVTDRNLIQEEIKKKLNSGNVCYHYSALWFLHLVDVGGLAKSLHMKAAYTSKTWQHFPTDT
jgi:hypothetical protein